ncbi:MAG: hypothetical protein ACRDWI_19740 [Jiangellaceae bacterium]
MPWSVCGSGNRGARSSDRRTVVAVAPDDVRITAEPDPTGWPPIGSVRPRTPAQITDSGIIIGAETLDRDHANYSAYAKYLSPPLGAKRARIQSGWAKTEQRPGVYSWGWLDTIVNDAVARGVRPWLQTSDGNPIYPGGGGTGLGSPLPSSSDALAAWDSWVTAMVTRYGDRVDEWEIWNEPSADAATYADFYVRTAERVRVVQPDAVLFGGAVASVHTDCIIGFLERVRDLGKLGLVDGVTYHPYAYNPDSNYVAVDSLRTRVAAVSPSIVVRQGENGAPSQQGGFGALNDHPWTERKRAKWDTRRVLGDLGRGISTSVFTMSNMRYSQAPSGLNSKGLVRTNIDHSVRYAKQAYYAVQAFRKAGTQQQAVAVWLSGAIPADTTTTTAVTFTFPSGNFADPVYVDLRTATVYDIPAANWTVSGTSHTFTSVPVYDSPILIADRSVVPT